jgi:TnpA family transposase
MATDGQKFETDDSTLKSRNSKKYFGKGKGVVAYTLLCNHIPIQSTIISPHEHESYYLFDIFANNTTILIPDIVTGDMHSINKCNFAIMNWFKSMLAPRFTNLDNEIKHTCCGYKKSRYKNYLIKPFAEIDIDLIIEEWPELQRILVSLHQKEVSQSIIVKKLCTYSKSNKTRKALFEYDKLIRSIYTLKYLLDPKLKKQVHASQNRIESYHQLRAAISKVNGKKELIGKNDIEIEISNECGRLVANAIIYYNSALLSKLLEKFLEENDVLSLKILKKISPVAYQHIHLLGQYTFNQKINEINLSELILKIDFQDI